MITQLMRRIVGVSPTLALAAALCVPLGATAGPITAAGKPFSAEAFSLSAIPAERLQAILNIVSNSSSADEINDGHGGVNTLSAIVVQGSASTHAALDSPSAPCGLLGVAWSLVHPIAAWRIVAPVLPSSNTDACFRAASGRVTAWSVAAISL